MRYQNFNFKLAPNKLHEFNDFCINFSTTTINHFIN